MTCRELLILCNIRFFSNICMWKESMAQDMETNSNWYINPKCIFRVGVYLSSTFTIQWGCVAKVCISPNPLFVGHGSTSLRSGSQ